MNVGTTAVSVGTGPGLVQNLGPDEMYVGNSTGLTSSTGVLVPANKAMAFGFSNTPIYVISAGASDVRFLYGGSGLFDSPAAA
jgi:hypothetical protein